MTARRSKLFLLFAVALLCPLWRATAQTAATTKSSTTGGQTINKRRPTAPQVVTIVHRLNGLKLLQLLVRSGELSGALDRMDEAFKMTTEVHTNIIAGLALDDGETIAVWLPDANLEIESPALPFNNMIGVPSSRVSTQAQVFAFTDTPDLIVIDSDGKRRRARYVGMDGLTGLSVLRLGEKSLPVIANANEKQIAVGQRMRLFSPEPIPSEATTKSVTVRIGEGDGQVVSIARGRSGEINRLKIKSAKLSPTNIGGVAINDAGQTVGIVEAVESGDAVVLPPGVIRGAAERVLKKQGSVPRPWLGVSGEPVTATSFEQIVRKGWEPAKATALIEKQRGIFLTSIVPDSPAAIAALRPGDVIVSVNDTDIKDKDDFSMLLAGVGSGNPARFTLVRPGRVIPETVTVKLSEAFSPVFMTKSLEWNNASALPKNPFIEHGIEAVPLRPAAATHFGSSGGLLVVFVQPMSAVFKSGLRPGDVIEAIDGQQISTAPPKFPETANATYTLNVVRNKQKLVLTVEPLEN
jgi:S1-C subfamily serine protease